MHKLQTVPITGLTLKKKIVIHSNLPHRHIGNSGFSGELVSFEELGQLDLIKVL